MSPTTRLRSVSEPSLGTIGTGTTHTVESRPSNTLQQSKSRPDRHRGGCLWEGRYAKCTLAVLMLPWNMWWQSSVLVTIIVKYIIHLLLAYYLDQSYGFIDMSLVISELFFICDLIVHLLHAFWPLVRLHIRVYRRNNLAMTYDAITLIPLTVIFRNRKGYRSMMLLGRWLGIGRIYRMFCFYSEINGAMRSSRKILFLVEHVVTMGLVIHAGTCFWFAMNSPMGLEKPWHYLGYPAHVSVNKIKFSGYKQCWYYVACRILNVIFGDAFPLQDGNKWITSALMLGGYVFLRYRFIGNLAWELVLENRRFSKFVERYHHMLNYLKNCGAPDWLVEQAQNYKLQLWQMKDGILNSEHLKELPHPLQMELIFDINVGHFHNSLLFRDTGEAFMRQISLLMRHELFLAGQQIWSQGVVKNGMICIKRGVVEMLSDEDDESPMIAFKEGTVLGELSLFYSIPSKVTVKAATYVELQVLRRTDFMRSMSENPCMLHVIRGNIERRLRSTRSRQTAIENYDKGDSRLIRTRYRPMKVLKDYLAGVEEEDPTFVDDSHMYYKDANNIRQPKFTAEYKELYQMSNNVTTIDAPRICIKSNFPWILEPDTDFTNMFNLAHFFMILFVCIMIPKYAIENSQSDAEKVLGIIVLAGLLLNIYIQLTTCIIDRNGRKKTVKEIAEVKMATFGFYLDVISVFPVFIFSDTLDPQGLSVWGQIAKLFPTLQVWHLWDYMGKWEKNFFCNVKFICLCKYSIVLLIFCYWSGCFLYIYGCPKKLCIENSWMKQLIFWETKVFVTNYAKHERPMVSSLAFGTAVFTGSGTGDFSPGDRDFIVVSVLFIIGTYLCSFYIAKVCSIYLLSTQRRLRFKESMRELFYFLTVNRVSGKIKARVKKFFVVQWYYNKAVSTEEIFQDMSANIEQEVLSTEMVETLLFCPLFQNCSRDFLQTVTSSARTIVLPDNEIVQHAADIGRDMYILQKGHCKVLNHNGKVAMSIGPGSHFGVIEMLFGLPKVYTVLTSTNCILRHVEYSTLVQCWSTFPDISHPINAILENEELKKIASKFDDAKPLIGRIDTKTNRIAQEIKESFVVIAGHEARRDFVREFDKLGIMRYLRFFFLPGTITPHGIFLKIWCSLRIAVAVIYILIIPYNIATKQQAHGASYSYLDIFLYVDMIVMCYVSYYNERSLLVTHPLLTVTRYLTRTFIWDAISIFPFERVFRIINEQIDLDFCRINRLLLVTRITGAFAYWETDIMRVNAAVVLMKFLPLAVMFVNLITCFIFMNSCKPYLPSHSNSIMVNCTRALVISGSKKYDTKYANREYLRSLFWVFEIFVGCGCTSVELSSSTDVWLVMALQITGYLYFAYMFGYVASTRSSSAHALLDHTENKRDLENFLYQENVDPNLTAKTMKYFEYVWKRTNGSNPHQICRCLNTALMEDTLVFMYEHALREVPLFGNVERSFIRVITQHLHEMYFLKEETVIQCKDIQHSIYIIYKGKVDVLSSYNEMLTCMGPGGMFGNFTGQPISCSEVSVFASRSLDLLVIPSQTFFNLVKYYPKIHEPLNKAFEISKDYILPISMDATDDVSSEESDAEIISQETVYDSLSGSSRSDVAGQVSSRNSQSDISQAAKSSASVMTYQSYMHASNLVRPGTWLYQGYGYMTCVIASANYVLLLYEIVTLNDCFIMCWAQSLFDIYFYIKTYFTIHQGYVNKRGDMVTNSAKCRARYFKHKYWVWSDIFTNVPLEPLGFCFPSTMKAMHYLRVNKLFRLKYIVEFYRKTAAELTNNITNLQLMTTTLVVLLLIHTFTCIWLLTLIATAPMSVIRTLKMHIVDENFSSLVHPGTVQYTCSRETPQNLWDYTTSFYLVVSELTTTGGDEFVIESVLPIAILTLSLVCGKMLAGIVVATCIQVAYSTKYALTSYERKTGELIDMLKNQGLSNYQLQKFWKYVKQLWVTERGRQLPVLLAQTPYVRRCDLMSAMFSHHLRNCFLFADTGEQFLRQLTVALDYTTFFPGNYIVVAGDSEARMYWVASGTVSVVSVRADLTETTHELLGPGDVFGILQGLNRGVVHCFSYRAETKVSILTLSLDSWINILPFFPGPQRIINERAEVLFAQL